MTGLANRVQEIGRFEALLERQCQRRILLVKAPSGYGKSELIDRFSQVVLDRGNLGLVKLELDGSVLGIAYLISRLQQKLKSERFPNYDKAVRQLLATPTIEMSDIEIEGNENQLQILLSTDEQQKQMRLARLEAAFFEDLAAIRRPIVLLIDTFERAPDELQKWIGCQFLAEVAENLDNFRVVVAGQEIPEPKLDWRSCHHCCVLGPIDEIDAWYDYVQAQQLQLNREFVKGIVYALKGRPRDIALTFESCRGGQP
jgi:hypothetical protein